MTVQTYRDFEIYPYNGIAIHSSYDWLFSHKDYDGEGDNRHGHAASVEECKAEIDEYWENTPSGEMKK